MKTPDVGDLVRQSRYHKSKVGSDWGIGTVVAEHGSIYLTVYWSRWSRLFKMTRGELEVLGV